MADLRLSMTMKDAAAQIQGAQERVVLVAPGVHQEVIESIVMARERLHSRVLVVIDTSEEVFRLGYGTVEVFRLLQESKVPLLRRDGIRLGVLLVDDEAWFFAPTALLVEADSREGSPRFNACQLPEIHVLQYLRALVGSFELEQALKGPLASEPDRVIAIPVSQAEVETTLKQLEIAPPVNFDLHRQVRVYQAYVQYAELQFRGAKPESKKAQIPKGLLPLGAEPEIEEHLQTTVDLFQKDVGAVVDNLNQKVEKVRNQFLRNLGVPYGAVVLRRDAAKLESEVAKIVEDIGSQQLTLAKVMDQERDKTIDKLAKVCVESLLRNPTKWLLDGVPKPKEHVETVKFFVTAELKRTLPQGFAIAGKMSLTCVFKDFTFKSLNEDQVFKKLRTVFPDEDWDRPYGLAKAALQSPESDPG